MNSGKPTIALMRRTFLGKSETFVDDKQADHLLTREYRKGFEIPAGKLS